MGISSKRGPGLGCVGGQTVLTQENQMKAAMTIFFSFSSIYNVTLNFLFWFLVLIFAGNVLFTFIQLYYQIIKYLHSNHIQCLT